MRTFLVFAASVLALSTTACEKTVQEARSPMSRQQLRQPSGAARAPARSRVLSPVQAQQARANSQRKPTASALRMPSLMQPLRTASQQASGRQSRSRAGQAQWNPAQALSKSKPKSDIDLLDLSKKILSKAWMLLL